MTSTAGPNSLAERVPPSASLVDAAMAGDPLALQGIWERNRRWVAAVILAHKPRSADADDLLQEVAVTVLAKIRTLDNPANFQPWLRVVAMNVARLAGRKYAAGPRMVRFDGAGDNEEGTGGPADRLGTADESPEVKEEARRVMGLAMELHADYREPLLLRCVQELSYAEIGEILGLPETTIETRIARGRRMLREKAGGARVVTTGSATGATGSVRMAASPDAGA